MSEVIAFKVEKDGTHLRPPPEGSAKIVFFTGVWHEPMNDRGGKKRRASESDVEGSLVQDCVCCNPWQVQVWTE